MKDEKPEGQSDGIKKKLNRTHQEWENIFQAIGHPAVILDPQLKIIAANNSSIKLTGQPAGELRRVDPHLDPLRKSLRIHHQL